MKRIIRNAAKCLKCNVILESKHRHDYVACACGNAVDGGKDYIKRTVANDFLVEMCEWEEVPE